jgi:excisionase family DNA binding protein
MPPFDSSKVIHVSAEASAAPAPAEWHHGDRKLAYSVPEFSKLSNLSRSLLYEAIRLGELQSIKVRGRRLILAEDGKTWLLSFRNAM